MYSQYWNPARGRKPDYRRYTVVEGEEQLPLGSTLYRKRPRTAEDEEARTCASRPNPEGSGGSESVSEPGSWKENMNAWQLEINCDSVTFLLHLPSRSLPERLLSSRTPPPPSSIRLVWNVTVGRGEQDAYSAHFPVHSSSPPFSSGMEEALTQGAQKVSGPRSAPVPDLAYATFLFDKLQRLQWPRRGRHVSADTCCEVCGAAFHQLRRLALRRALGISREMPPRPTAPSVAPTTTRVEGWTTANELPVKLQQCRWSYQEEKEAGERLSGWGRVQSCYLGAGGATGSVTVTPLPMNAHQCLEGVWRVSNSRTPQHHPATVSNVKAAVKGTTHSIATQTSQRPSAAAAFFTRAAQKLSLSRRKKSHPVPPELPVEDPGQLVYSGGFSGALQLSPPAVPPCLLRAGSKVKDTPGMGKVRVMVRICSVQNESSESMSFLKVDGCKKQLTLCETANGGQSGAVQKRSSSAAAPKTFMFDAIFSQDASQAEVCSGTVAEVIQSVVNGADGCIFCFGHADLGKTYTMIGRECSTQSLGVAPTAISWVFKVIEERKEKAGMRFSVLVSAVEISGREETLTDLLADLGSSSATSSSGSQQEAPGPGVSLQEDPVCGSQLQNQTELRACSAERAAFLLDFALAARRSSQEPGDWDGRRNSHFLFTLHLHQEKLDKSNKAASQCVNQLSAVRSRLHLLDLGSCETDISRTREGGGGQCLSLSALGNVILALANGAKHVPYRDSKLTMLLSESLGNINCRTTMIAHISDSPNSYMETLTTVQLASRIHRMRKKKTKYASSSSGGESSCEEGRPHRPHLRPFHPRTVALDPDTPLLLSSDPDYSSSSEHSCDTVIYVGPGGTAVSDRELSDNEGPPAFVPIIPSLTKRRVKDAPRTDGDHLKCNTFAELQERLDCIDGSEGQATFSAEGKAAQTASPRTQNETAQDTTSPLKPNNSESTSTNEPDQDRTKVPSTCNVMDTSRRTSADGEKISASSLQQTFLQDSEPVVRAKVYLKGNKASASPFSPRTMSQPVQMVARTPPVGMSQQALRQGQPEVSPLEDGAHHRSRGPIEMNHLRAALFGQCLDRDFLRTTVTLQQPVELNGEDELVFTFVEELPIGIVPDNGRPSSIFNFSSDRSLQPLATTSQPVSIISSINDEFDAYTSQQQEPSDGVTTSQGMPSSSKQSSSGLWSKEVNMSLAESGSTPPMSRLLLRNQSTEKEISTLPSSSTEPFLQHGPKSSLNDSGVCFSDLESDHVTPNRSTFIKNPPSSDSTKAFLKGSKVRAGTLNTSVSHHSVAAYSSLPRKTKPTSSCSRQEGRHDERWLQGSSQSEHREVEISCAGKPPRSGTGSITSRRPGGNSNSVPRPPKAQVSSSAQRVVDGCEKSSSRRGDPLIKMPRLIRGATTLGTVSVHHSSPESKWSYDIPSVTGSLRFSSLGKKSNGQKSSGIPKSGSLSIASLAPIVRQPSLDLKSRTVISQSAFKTSGDTGKASMPKTSTSVEEFSFRMRADSFSQKTSSLKTEHVSIKTSSLKTRGAKADSSRYYESLLSLERCDSRTSDGSKHGLSRDNSGANLAGSSRCNRSVPRLGVPASTPSLAPSSLISPGIFATTSKQVQAKGSSSSRAAVSGGSKIRTLSASSAKSLGSSTKTLDITAGRNTNLTPTGKSPARVGTGAKQVRGTIMGTKQAINRAANSRVSELAAGSLRKPFSRGSGIAENDGSDSGMSSISASPNNTPLPSPYSKITAPRRPQRYSSGHGSDNSSILSGELPPAMGRTALFYHSGGSSGYESMIRDSETTGSTSSAHESMSESTASSSNRSRVSKSPKKRGNGFLRRRLIPVPLPDTSTLGKKSGGQWVDLPPLGGTLTEQFEIKVYEIDDVERLQRREAGMGSEQPFHDVEKGLLYFNARLRMLEKQQQQIQELKSKHESLKVELEEAKSRLMLHPNKWSGEFDVDQDLDKESLEYLEALDQATAELEYCVNLCKSHVMMETCFDISGVTCVTMQAEQPEVEV
ncbi:kinesin-like protein KIF26A [Genypterus blacodes]|uniref:kinesin-like protein KIF26A n=1 Tax=Genypterus blacodes TaxID=154954 RepID=UPI003F76D774